MVFDYMSFKKPIAESNLAKDADWLLNWRETLIFFKSVLVHFKLVLIRKRGSSVVRHLPLVLEVPGSIPARGEKNFGVRTRFL